MKILSLNQHGNQELEDTQNEVAVPVSSITLHSPDAQELCVMILNQVKNLILMIPYSERPGGHVHPGQHGVWQEQRGCILVTMLKLAMITLTWGLQMS